MTVANPADRRVHRERLDRPATVADLRMLEARLFSEPHPPPPSDLDAEAHVLCALFDGRVVPDIDTDDFFAEMNRVTFAIASAFAELRVRPTVEAVAVEVERFGFAAKEVREYLTRLAYEIPYIFHIGRTVARLRALARRRRAIELVVRAEAELRTSDGAEGDVLRLLERAVAELQGERP